MARMSLLEIVQEILSDLNSDEVNSISDTVEAMQVATIVKRTYFNILNDRLWPHQRKLMQLVPYSDNNFPTHMKLAEEVIELDWVKYDIAGPGEPSNFLTMHYRSPAEFINLVMARDAADTNVQTVIDPSGVPLFIRNDDYPSYYTTFNDETLVFDSFDSTVDSTLQASKVSAYGSAEASWEMSDEFVPEMPAKYFPYLVNEAKSTAFIKIKEVFSQKDEQNANRQKGWLSQEKSRAARDRNTPDYGRKAPGRGRYWRHGYRNNHFIG